MEMVPRPVDAIAARADAGQKAWAKTVRIAAKADMSVPVADGEDRMTRRAGAGQARPWPHPGKNLAQDSNKTRRQRVSFFINAALNRKSSGLGDAVTVFPAEVVSPRDRSTRA
jgi:hypothetical protein